MENAIIILRMITTIVNYVLLTVFGMIAVMMLCLMAYACLLLAAGNGASWPNIRAILAGSGIWGWLSAWFLHTSRYRRYEVSGLLFPIYWATSVLMLYAAGWLISGQLDKPIGLSSW